MPSFLHEALLSLFEGRPELAPDLLERALGAEVPPHTAARIDRTDLTEVVPAAYRADLVVLLSHGEDRPRPVLGIVVEVQLGKDEAKRFSWPFYVVGLRARLKVPVLLLVVAVDQAVAAWASAPIAIGPDGFVLTPSVLGPDRVPAVTDPLDAAQAPELAVLSALAHGTSERAPEIALVALGAVARLDEDRALLYADLVRNALGDAARIALEAMMDVSKYEFQSDFAKKYIAIGKAEGKAEGEAKGKAEGEAKGKAEGEAKGKAEGEAKGKAEAVLAILRARGLDVPDAAAERILACRDVAELDRWIARALSVSSADELRG